MSTFGNPVVSCARDLGSTQCGFLRYLGAHGAFSMRHIWSCYGNTAVALDSEPSSLELQERRIILTKKVASQLVLSIPCKRR